MTYLTSTARAQTESRLIDGVEATQYPVRSSNRYADLTLARLGLQARAMRGQFFNPKLFSDPAWDILLELYAASLVECRLNIARLTGRSGVPQTTVLRWIATLEKEGLIEKHEPHFDRRQVLLSLSEKGRSAMASFFECLEPETRLI